VNIARRGPPSSTQRPNTADETPRKKMAMENIQPSSVEKFRHRQIEHAERVRLSDAQMHAKCRRRHHPSAIARLRDRFFAVEE
jgi:hypothetical protein